MKPSKKTTTILNRFTPYTLSWWAKLSFISGIFFLFISCEDDFLLGFKNEPKKFDVNYVEIPLNSTTIWVDSVLTMNQGFSGETSRLLAGNYSDPVFGNVSAQTIMHYRPTVVNQEIKPTAIYDSIILNMRVDFYHYGIQDSSLQIFTVHELTDELFTDKKYYANSSINFNTEILGKDTLPVSSNFYKAEFDDTNTDPVITLKVKLSDTFGQRLFNACNWEDLNFTYFELFKTQFKGLAIVPENTNKIIGFNPSDANSSMVMYYHDGTDNKTLSFSFSTGINFSKISVDRSTSELAGITNPNVEYQTTPKAYIQGGSSVLTKLDLTYFYNYFDSIPDNMIINSAEIEVLGVESSDYYIPKGLGFSMLTSDNKLKVYEAKDSTVYRSFAGLLASNTDLNLSAADDQGSALPFNYLLTDNSYSAFPTLFFQKLHLLRATRYPYWALRPTNPQLGKSVDRMVFPTDKIKLKIYYTRPAITNQ